MFKRLLERVYNYLDQLLNDDTRIVLEGKYEALEDKNRRLENMLEETREELNDAEYTKECLRMKRA